MQVAATQVLGITEERERADLAHVSPMLERIEGWIETGIVGGTERNAADYQIAPSVCLLMYRIDLREAISSRPSGELAQAIVRGGERRKAGRGA